MLSHVMRLTWHFTHHRLQLTQKVSPYHDITCCPVNGITCCAINICDMLTIIPQTCPLTTTSWILVRPRNVIASASLNRSQAQQPLSVQYVDCAKARRLYHTLQSDKLKDSQH